MTLVLSMPALGNVGGLLALITFIYSVLGVQVMGTRGLGWRRDGHAWARMTSDDF